MFRLLLTVLVLALAHTANAQGRQAKPLAERLDRAQAGQPAPAHPFEGKGQPGLSLAQMRGKPMVVNLWATWCPPCLKEMPSLDRLQGQLGQNARVVAVSLDRGGWRAVDAFWAKLKPANLQAYVDKTGRLGFQLKAAGLPVTILYDAQGREIARLNGEADWASPEAVALVRRELKLR